MESYCNTFKELEQKPSEIAFNSPGVLLQLNAEHMIRVEFKDFQFSWSLIATSQKVMGIPLWVLPFNSPGVLLQPTLPLTWKKPPTYFQFSWSLIATGNPHRERKPLPRAFNSPGVLLQRVRHFMGIFARIGLSILLESYCNA